MPPPVFGMKKFGLYKLVFEMGSHQAMFELGNNPQLSFIHFTQIFNMYSIAFVCNGSWHWGHILSYLGLMCNVHLP